MSADPKTDRQQHPCRRWGQCPPVPKAKHALLAVLDALQEGCDVVHVANALRGTGRVGAVGGARWVGVGGRQFASKQAACRVARAQQMCVW